MKHEDFRTRVRKKTEGLREVEGACGICHGTLEAITEEKGVVSAYERSEGILAVVKDDSGDVIGEGFDIVWSSAILAAELDAKLVPERFEEKLREALSEEDEIRAIADVYGYGRVVTPSVIALQYVKDLGGKNGD